MSRPLLLRARLVRPSLVLGTLLGLAACGQDVEHPAAAVGAAKPDAGFQLSPADHEAESCVGVQVMAEPLPVDLFAVVDGSSSMRDATFTGASKWYATKEAFRGFLEDAPSGMGFGLSLFPIPGDDTASCAVQRYRDAALPISDVEQMAAGALARLDAVTPQGRTPTAPALDAALEQATSYAEAHRDRSVIVVLATDGLPTACDPKGALALGELAARALRGPGHVRTLVVAVTSLVPTEQAGFEQIAIAGGTGRSLTIDPKANFALQLNDALSSAARREVSCDLALPEPPEHLSLDYDAVNVVVEGRTSRGTLPRVAGPESCSQAGGWYYDVDPLAAAPSRLNICKSSCGLSAADHVKLRVELGCKTVVR